MGGNPVSPEPTDAEWQGITSAAMDDDTPLSVMTARFAREEIERLKEALKEATIVARLERPAVEWGQKRPEALGWYWYRRAKGKSPKFLCVWADDQGRLCFTGDSKSGLPKDVGVCVPVAKLRGEWAGPVIGPTEPEVTISPAAAAGG